MPPIARKTNRARGHVKGERVRYVLGHKGTRPTYHVEDRGFATACHIWDGSLVDGYGRLWRDGRLQLAHRVAFEDAHGPLAPGLEPDHLCRQRACVRVEHLEAVTHAVNCQRGANATVTQAIVVEIRRRYAAGGISQQALADHVGITQAAVSKIVTGRTWRAAA